MGIFKISLVLSLLLLPSLSYAQVYISEIMYDSPGADDDWVEIYNSGLSPVAIITGSGSESWRFVDNAGSHLLTLTSGSATLVPSTYAIITNDTTKFIADWTGFSGTLFKSSFSLTNTSNIISIKDGGGVVTDPAVSYASTQGAKSDGNSLQRQTGGTWIAAAPTPGSINSSTSAFTSTTTNQTATTTTDTTTGETATGSTYSSSGQSSSNTVTTYYISAPLSAVNKETKFAVGAGRDRFGSVGSPLEFKAETEIEYTRNNIFKWNFGDGNEGVGKVLSHTYEYPGEYVVMLNATATEGQAVARVNVKIIEPEIVVTLATPERIEIKNNSKYEISLFGRALVSSGKVFVFPQDTILKAGQNISFGAKITGLRPDGIQKVGFLVLGETMVEGNLITRIEKKKSEQIASIRDKIAVLQQQRLVLSQREVSSSVVAIGTVNSSSTSQAALVIDSVSQIKSGRINGWLETLRRFFFRTQ